MKYLYVTLITFLFPFWVINATIDTIHYRTIKWTDIETYTSPLMQKKVIAFENASYPASNDLPYFTERFQSEKSVNLQFRINNPHFISTTNEELELIDINSLPEEIELVHYLTEESGTIYTNVQILPFIKKDNAILKLTNFELEVVKIPGKQRVASSIHSYAASSVLSSGKFIKVKISESGIYKLTYEALQSMGIDPANVRVFGYGGALLEQDFMIQKYDDLPEVAVWMEKGSDGVFNAGDYILFYGQGVVKWYYDASLNIFTHTLNHYSNEGYYFITSDVGTGKRIEEVSVQPSGDANVVEVNRFVDYKLHELEKINLGKSGKVFYGEEFSSTLSYSFPFSFPNITNDNVKIKIDVAAISSSSSSFLIKLNNNESKTLPVSAKGLDNYEIGKSATAQFDYLSPETDALNFSLTYSRTDNAGKGYLNYLTVQAKRYLVMDGSVLFFRNVDNLGSATYSKYQISGANSNTQIWDVTDPVNVQRMKATWVDGKLEFIDTNEQVKQYVAIDPTDKNHLTLSPTKVGQVTNQNLHALSQPDMVIIAHPNFVSQAEKLAEAHRQKDGMTVHVVTTEQVYNEFSSGTPDATAYRWVMKMFYDRGKELGSTKPMYLLLFGRGSYDNRGIITNSGNNLILTYQADASLHYIKSYVTDDYFGFLDDNEGAKVSSNLLDIGIGRFPAVTAQHAEDIVNKTIAYMNNTISGNWKNQLGFVADDGDNSLHVSQADGITQEVQKLNNSFQIQKIYLDSYLQEVSASGDSYPLAQKKLQSLINTGILMLNYTGHAAQTGWTDEKVLSTNDIKELYNTKLPLWIGATCDFVLFDVKDISAGEMVLLNASGGGIGILSASRTVWADRNRWINQYFTTNLFDKSSGAYPRLGDALKYAKNKIGTEENKLSFVLLGDPAIRLNYPEPYSVSATEINGNAVNEKIDTIRALSVNTIKGVVVGESGSLAEDFNGIVEVTVYDKKQQITTLNNHNESGGVFQYSDYPNILYSGKAQVHNGEFALTFMAPKDIRYNFGKGRMTFYVSDATSGLEGQGYFENFVVGGSSSNIEYEEDGPIIDMYLNTPSFTSGDKVNETPLLVAHVSDHSGINTSGNGIGHDLRLVIDNNAATSYTLNENFEADNNSYQSGTVRLKLPSMEPGKHTLTLYAWDMLNNSSQATLDFEVVAGLTPVIFNVRNYPNPVLDATTFVIEHDRPEVILEATIDVFDLSGRIIFTKQQSSADNLKWNLEDNMGNRVKPGMYLYRISIKTTNSELTSKSNKIVVLGQ